jgi:signal transduction histidine kinase/CheY-like chemotaxis protein
MPRQQRSVEDFYFVYFCLSAVFCLVLIIPVLDHAALYRPASSAVLTALIITSLLVLWRFGVSRLWLQLVFQATLLWAVLYNAYDTGGITSPLMVWMGIVPILPLFTVSRRSGYVSLFVSFLCVISVYVLQVHGWIPVTDGVTARELLLSVLMNGLLCITLLMLVITYDSIHAQHVAIIQRKNGILKRLSNRLQLADKHKDSFLATVSHEMRTPLNAMMGYLGLLQSTQNLTPNAASYVEGAHNSASHLLTVINDLLDFSQIQKGKLVLTPQDVDLHEVLRNVHKTLELKAADKNIQFDLLIKDDVPRWIKIDPHRLSQIFLNLLGNALKFTREGAVTTHVTYEPHEQVPRSDRLLLQVQDTGIGIPRAFFPRIFEPFSQLPVQNPTDSALRGNGLGLSITQTLVTSMGGQITLDSQVGVGSVFEVKLPIHIINEPLRHAPEPSAEVHLEPIHLLLVDDHATNRLVASATIQQDLPNARIDQASNGAEAIEKMKAHRYDLVLMDLIMPDHSGIEVTRIIREAGIPGRSDVKVIALTASVAETVAQECLAVGIDEILRKPFERSSLIRTILQHAPHHSVDPT